MDLELLRKTLHYDLETGVFTRLAKGKAKVGSDASGGYLKIYTQGKEYRAHRLAWFYVHGQWPKDQIDHINGNPKDNRLINLREADNALNRRNQKLRSDNVSGVVGVSFDTRSGKWDVRVAGRCIGLFLSKSEAIAARKEHAALDNFHPNHGRLV